MDYEIPEPSKDPMGALVIYYKVVRGFEFDDRAWDRIHFPRCLRAAKSLLEICQDFEQAKRCLDQMGAQFDEKDLSWTLETIVKHAHEWRQRRGKKNDTQNRKRFFDALAKQRSEGTIDAKGKVVTGGEILGPLGNLEVFQSPNRGKDRSTDGADGGTREAK